MPINTDPSVNGTGKTQEVLVLTSATYLPGGASHAPLSSRKAVEIQNLGPNPIYVTVDGTAPLSTGAKGRRIDAAGGTWAINAGPNIILRAICSVAQVTTAATQVTEVA